MLSHNKCEYFVDESLQNEKGFFGVSEIKHAEPISQNGTKFQVVTDARTWKLEADTNEIMCNWVRSFNEQAAPATDMISVSDIDIEGKKPEEFRGLSIWLELPDLQDLVDLVCKELNCRPHRSHIAILYGITEEQYTLSWFKKLAQRIALCYDDEWSEIESQSMQLAFIDLYFQLSKELSELYKMASDIFYCDQTLRSLVRPRCCLGYGDLSLPAFQNENLESKLNERASKLNTVYKFGKISIWKTQGSPEKWQELASYSLAEGISDTVLDPTYIPKS